jgi:hypothetical protein
MRRVLSTALLAVLWAGVVQAQETTGAKAEEVKQEVLKIETDKLAYRLNHQGSIEDWNKRYDAVGIAVTQPNGARPTAEEHVAHLKDPNRAKLRTNNQSGYQVRVYDDGKVAVVTFNGENTFSTDAEKDKITTQKTLDTDVWFKFPDGMWRRIVHDAAPAAGECSGGNAGFIQPRKE